MDTGRNHLPLHSINYQMISFVVPTVLWQDPDIIG